MRKPYLLVPIAASAICYGGSCDSPNNPEYRFDAMVGSEHVRFYETGWYGENNYLEIIAEDGTKYVYHDGDDDFVVDDVRVIGEGIDTHFKSSAKDKAVQQTVKDAQKTWIAYLEKIVDIKGLPIRKKIPDF